MSKIKVALGFAATFTALTALASAASARDLTVVSWGGAYQDVQKKVYFGPFKETGTPMNDESWDGGVGLLRAKVQGGASTWDVVQVESEELALGCDEGLYEKINYSKIGGEDIYLPATVNPCGVGAIATSTSPEIKARAAVVPDSMNFTSTSPPYFLKKPILSATIGSVAAKIGGMPGVPTINFFPAAVAGVACSDAMAAARARPARSLRIGPSSRLFL